MRLIVGPFFISLFLVGCYSTESSTKEQASVGYAIDSLIDAQVSALNGHRAKIKKCVMVGDTSEIVDMDMDSTKWRKLFAPLDILDINKPSVIANYKKIIILDTLSNLSILQYKLKEKNSSQNLKSLSVYYLHSLNNIKKITAFTIGKGYIYNSRNELALFFDQVNNQPMISEFSIFTTQKTLLKDSINWAVQTKVIY